MGGAIAAGVVTAGLAAGQDVCVTHARAALLERLEKQHCVRGGLCIRRGQTLVG